MVDTKKQFVEIPVRFDHGILDCLKIFEETAGTLFEVDETEAISNLEAATQIVEGYSYEYELPVDLLLEEQGGLVTRFKSRANAGRITPGIYTGTIELRVFRKSDGGFIASIPLEVRSQKIGYRDDYRNMLEEISNQCVDLILQSTSLSSHHVVPDFAKDSRTLYQKFAFVKSVINSNEFMESVHRIFLSPVTRWERKEVELDVRRIGRVTRSELRQIASSGNRIGLPESHPLYDRLGSVPLKIRTHQKHDSPDNPENQFVKHVLTTFLQFCTAVREKLNSGCREYSEAKSLENKLHGLLDHSLFREISDPVFLPLNSPVLQRKEGYREVLSAWLKFDLSSKLAWSGGDDVYSAGKRNIAVLYEYWLFFKLLELFRKKFSINVDSIDSLFEKTTDGLGLKLASGTHHSFIGAFDNGGRKLSVRFGFNRIFSGGKRYPQKGSWTKSMRPDYTFSFWPSDYSEDEAEGREIITHIHFDAKYKVVNLGEIFTDAGADDESSASEVLTQEKNANRMGIYKQADLLKMHAYKDAIRRTGGAYVLYPGSENESCRGFHEVLPGLGAFAVRPSDSNSGISEVSDFIDKVVGQLLDRTSQQERHSYYTYDIHKDGPKEKYSISDALPEYWGKAKDRTEPLNSIGVLIGYCKDSGHYDWIARNRKYNIRIETVQPAPMFFGAKYLLLHSKGSLKTSEIWRIVGSRPKILSKAEMLLLDYKNPRDFYLVYSIEKVPEGDFQGLVWDISKLDGYSEGHQSARPFAASLAELMKVEVSKSN